MVLSSQNRGVGICKWGVINLFLIYHLSLVRSLNVKSLPYSIINMEEDAESLLKLSENSDPTKEEVNPHVSRRGYAGEDFYQKASKNIPRMGRRGLRSSNEEQDENKIKRPYLVQQIPEESLWPWHTDRVPTHIKRGEIVDNCLYEFCNDNSQCCSPLKDPSILKRFLQTYSSKQTAPKPNYKNNQYMK